MHAQAVARAPEAHTFLTDTVGMQTTTITDISDSRINYYRSLQATPVAHVHDHVFIAEGEKTVRALLRSSLDILSFFALPKYYERLAPLLVARGIPDDKLFTADHELMNAIVGFRLHQGIMAIAQQPAEPALRQLQPPIAILDGIVDSENVGAIVRNCAAFGVRSLVVGGGSSPYLRRAVRASMGAVCFVQVHFSEDLPYTIGELREQYGIGVIALEQHERAIPIENLVFPERCALVFGSEGSGISPEVLTASNAIAAISQQPDIDSLNVASAAAVALHALYSSFSRTASSPH